MTDAALVRVLLVEDDEDAYLLTHSRLRKINGTRYDLVWVTNGEDALAVLAHEFFDVCLMDYYLRDGTGMELLKRFDRRIEHPPVIMLTGASNRQLDMAAMGAGAVDYLVKDRIDPELLERSIRYALERERLLRDLEATQEKLRHQAAHDELTGLYNRRWFMSTLEKEISVAKRHHYPLSMCISDLDRFKVLNDRFGHLAGDQALEAFAKVLAINLRLGDTAARIGGDEFAVLLPQASRKQAGPVVQRIKTALESLRLVAPNGEEFAIGASFGIAEMKPSMSPADLIHRADEGLYKAKRAKTARGE